MPETQKAGLAVAAHEGMVHLLLEGEEFLNVEPSGARKLAGYLLLKAEEAEGHGPPKRVTLHLVQDHD